MQYRAGTSFRAVQKARHLQRHDAARAVRTELIESNALRAVRRGYWEDALELYTLAAEKSGAGRSYLLLALHLQRLGADAESTRDAFATGVRRDRTCAQLVQAAAARVWRGGRVACRYGRAPFLERRGGIEQPQGIGWRRRLWRRRR